MVDETHASTTTEQSSAPAAAPVKKQRAPRAAKTDATKSAAASEPVKKNRGGRPKRVESAVAAPVAAAETVKTRRKRGAASDVKTGKRGPGRAATPSTKTSPMVDDLAELLQLEEENMRLRKSLAEKLRAENADLRGRLGLK